MAKRGHNVSVYERRSDMRKAELVAGRSINLALSTRGWTALKKVGIDDEVRKMAIPMPKRIMHAQDGTLVSNHMDKMVKLFILFLEEVLMYY